MSSRRPPAGGVPAAGRRPQAAATTSLPLHPFPSSKAPPNSAATTVMSWRRKINSASSTMCRPPSAHAINRHAARHPLNPLHYLMFSYWVTSYIELCTLEMEKGSSGSIQQTCLCIVQDKFQLEKKSYTSQIDYSNKNTIISLYLLQQDPQN